MAEKFHWTLDTIEKLPYKWIQRFYLFQKAKTEARNDKMALQEMKSQSGPKKGGRSRVVTDLRNLANPNSGIVTSNQ